MGVMGPAERIVSKLSDKAIRDYRMIEPGARILVAVSGGKDSAALARVIASWQRHSRERFDYRCVHVATDFGASGGVFPLRELFSSWDIPCDELLVRVVGRLKEGERMNCWWCATQRRTELIKYAARGGWNKIALGHHLDEILETLFMNMLDKGEFSTMPPVMRYRKYPVTVIRPLALTEERQLISLSEELGIAGMTCVCSYDSLSVRKTARKRIEILTGGSSRLKRNIYRSMSNVRGEYLA